MADVGTRLQKYEAELYNYMAAAWCSVLSALTMFPFPCLAVVWQRSQVDCQSRLQIRAARLMRGLHSCTRPSAAQASVFRLDWCFPCLVVLLWRCHAAAARLTVSAELCLKHGDTLWLFACSQRLTLALPVDTDGPVMNLEKEQNEQLQLLHRLLAFILVKVPLLLQIGLHHYPSSYLFDVDMYNAVAVCQRLACGAPHGSIQPFVAPAWSQTAHSLRFS